jgi:nucleotide-binding universal stress UspA family protein
MRPDQLFDHVVCAVDGTPASAEAARQADLLSPAGRTLHVITVVTEAKLGSGPGYALSSGDWQQRLQPALDALPAERTVETAPIFHPGPPADALVDELARRKATLVVVGSHDHRRLPGILLGSVATALLHEAPCSVLITRLDHEQPRSIRTLAAGYDGSAAADAAHAVAERLVARLRIPLTVVVADDAQPPPSTGGEVRVDPRPAVDALIDAGCDLLVLGSRGLRGVAALGSVSERVAHTAHASVLVLRPE